MTRSPVIRLSVIRNMRKGDAWSVFRKCSCNKSENTASTVRLNTKPKYCSLSSFIRILSWLFYITEWVSWPFRIISLPGLQSCDWIWKLTKGLSSCNILMSIIEERWCCRVFDICAEIYWVIKTVRSSPRRHCLCLVRGYCYWYRC